MTGVRSALNNVRDPDPRADRQAGKSVDVWTVSLSEMHHRVEELEVLLTPDERGRASRFVFDKDRRRFILARSLLRVLLGRYLDLPPAHVVLQYGPHGKPAVAEAQQSPPGLQFNLSHSGEHCLYALAWGRQVGVDIEVIRADVEYLTLAERFFTRQEYEDLQRTADEDRPARFFHYWTCKEAYLKARGLGLSSGLAVEGMAEADGAVHFVASGEGMPSHWMVRPLEIAGPVAAAVGGEGQDWTMVVTEWKEGQG